MTDNAFSIEPEIAVISLILNNPDLIYNTNHIKSFMFNSIPHRTIFDKLMELADGHLQPEFTMVVNKIVSDNLVEQCGGLSYITHLKNQVFQKDNFQEYINLIKNIYKTRSLISIGSSLNMETVRIDGVDTKISEVKEYLDRLIDDSMGDGTFPIEMLIKESYKTIMDRTSSPGIKGISWGIKQIDSTTGGFDKGDLWYIGGRPGSGKTALICTEALALGKRNIPTLLFSKEMSRQPLIERFVSLGTDVPLYDIRMGFIKQPQIDKIYDFAKELAKYPIFIDLNYTGSIEQTESVIRKYKETHDVNTVFIDYIQLLSERSADQTQELGRISRKLKLLANSLEISIVVLSQLNREIEHRDNKRPLMSDLRQCGNLEEDADFVIGLYRDEYYNPETKDKNKLEFIVLKDRNGPVGTMQIGFDKITTKVSEEY